MSGHRVPQLSQKKMHSHRVPPIGVGHGERLCPGHGGTQWDTAKRRIFELLRCVPSVGHEDLHLGLVKRP